MCACSQLHQPSAVSTAQPQAAIHSPAPPVPPLLQERRKELTKQVSKLGEEGKVAVRNVRKDVLKKAGQVGDLGAGCRAGAGAGAAGCCALQAAAAGKENLHVYRLSMASSTALQRSHRRCTALVAGSCARSVADSGALQPPRCAMHLDDLLLALR